MVFQVNRNGSVVHILYSAKSAGGSRSAVVVQLEFAQASIVRAMETVVVAKARKAGLPYFPVLRTVKIRNSHGGLTVRAGRSQCDVRGDIVNIRP